MVCNDLSFLEKKSNVSTFVWKTIYDIIFLNLIIFYKCSIFFQDFKECSLRRALLVYLLHTPFFIGITFIRIPRLKMLKNSNISKNNPEAQIINQKEFFRRNIIFTYPVLRRMCTVKFLFRGISSYMLSLGDRNDSKLF